MYLENYIRNLKKNYKKNYFSGISFNSSKIKKDNIFFAIKGNKLDGNNYVNDAIKNGAKIIISEKKLNIKKDKVLFLHTKNVRKLLAEFSYKTLNKKYKKIIAVTGTNGKSSISDFYYQILNLNKKKVGSIGTIGVKQKNKKKELANTTLDPLQLREIINGFNNERIDHIILEASSHGLKQNRLDGLLFDIGIFTNLSHDHLDYHKNFKAYLNSKLYLFENLIKKNGTIITDNAIPELKRIKKIAKKKKLNLITIFSKNSDLELVSHKFKNESQILKIKHKNTFFSLKLNLIGKIQVKNIFMAILAAEKSDLNMKSIIKIIDKIKPVEGRLEKIGNIKNNSKVILDYAHTPDALKTVLLNIKEQFPSTKISLVFGCGGDRDKEKRSKMGKIADQFTDFIYLTDDNPRNENAKKIRGEIKKGIKNKIINEISDRKKAIFECIKNLKSGEIAVIAGKGHEKTQEYHGKKIFLSDKKEILRSISFKNKLLFEDLKLNIINEMSRNNLPKNIIINNARINSKEIKKNDIFFAIKGKKNDGNRFALEAVKKGASLTIVNQINNKYPSEKQIKVKDSLSFLTKCSSIYRENVISKIIAITGSCGKTSLKEMLGNTLKKISKTSCSPKSYNNKYGVPLSLFNLKEKDAFGVFEVGMDKKGEVDNLTKIIKPNVGIITNISYAHSKNFKTIDQIAKAKSEIIDNIKKDGAIILNADDHFYKLHKKKAIKKKLEVLSFSINNKTASTKLYKIEKINNKFKIFIKVNNSILFFYFNNDYENNIQNLLATITVINLFFDIKLLSKNIFIDFRVPEGRGDISKIKIKNKTINLIDESYNSNPLSLKTALLNYNKIKFNQGKKHIILGDMLELGRHSVKQHQLISKTINKIDIDKVHIMGKDIIKTYEKLMKNKKGKILNSLPEIIDLINNNLDNNDYLMIKGSNSTGLYSIVYNLKHKNLNVL
jgi:murE/murF fusion protein